MISLPSSKNENSVHVRLIFLSLYIEFLPRIPKLSSGQGLTCDESWLFSKTQRCERLRITGKASNSTGINLIHMVALAVYLTLGSAVWKAPMSLIFIGADLGDNRNGRAQVGFARDVKNSLLFQYDWAELLSAAPLALSLMGSCYVAATSPLANAVSLKDAEPKGGFKYIKHPELKACLIQISDAGRMAFIVAEKNMDLINSTCVSLGGYMGSILQYLPSIPDPAASEALNNKLELLKEGSNDCLGYAQAIEDEFKRWLLLVCELHQVSAAKEDKVEIAEQETNNKIAGVKIEAELTELNLTHAQDAAKTLKANLDDAKKLYEKAADAVPGPWEGIGLNLVSGLASQTSTLLAQSLPIMMMAASPMAGMAMLSGKKDGNEQSNGAQGNKGNKPPRSSAQHTTPTSHAYPDSEATAPMIATLLALLTPAAGEKIQWGSLLKSDDKGKDRLTSLNSTLKFQLSHYKWTNEKPSQDLKGAINKCLDVIAALTKVSQDSHGIVNKEPNEETVKKWRDSVDSAILTVTTLRTVASGMPGNAPTASHPPHPSTTPLVEMACLNSAAEKMNTTQAVYTAAQENYAKASESAIKVEKELAGIKASLESLQAEKMTMEGVKTVLIQCIGALHVVKRNVQDFVKQIGSAQRLLAGGLSMLDVSRQELYTISLMCQAYFSLFSTIARMYTTISVNHIMPGVKLCDQLSLSTNDPKAITQRARNLNDFTDQSQRAVRDIVAKTQKETSRTLEDRVTTVSKDIEMLPPRLNLPPALSKAITDGKEALTAPVAEVFDNKQSTVGALLDVGVSLFNSLDDSRILNDAQMDPNDI
ncbi:hypothetical protein BD779DRAFT_1661291 [Infundibulicybe gibba]|nr:hypothetical protein BD779DRAFT_1661291 [Infundibulicybe gibba]